VTIQSLDKAWTTGDKGPGQVIVVHLQGNDREARGRRGHPRGQGLPHAWLLHGHGGRDVQPVPHVEVRGHGAGGESGAAGQGGGGGEEEGAEVGHVEVVAEGALREREGERGGRERGRVRKTRERETPYGAIR
jgi:hypothetical protein